MHRYRFSIARAGFILLFAGITVIQIFSFPGQFQHMRRVDGIPLLIEIALTLLVGAWLACGQLALFSLWKIVGEMMVDQFFGVRSFMWINRLVNVLRAACVFPVIIFAMLAPQADDPGFFVLLSVVTIFLIVLTTFSTLVREQIVSSRE